MPVLRLFSHELAVAEALAAELKRLSEQAISSHGLFRVALSGGSTPKTLFRLLVSDIWRNRIDWSRTEIFWADERCVPQNQDASNAGTARRLLLDHVPVYALHPMWTDIDDSPEQAAMRYENLLRRLNLTRTESGFDAVLLGMGSDGHTASLFPDSPLLDDREHAVGIAHAPEYIAQNPAERVRLTLLPCVFSVSSHCFFSVCGESKAQMLARVFEGDDGLPASRIESKTPPVWLADMRAYALFPPQFGGIPKH
ncbi:MAG: 6-phosphogluconolactonase [Desulfovibrionaceae bacterium]|nr:6-phosphogluconolactonase [Desulfovibrionaceae bacterium]